MTSVVPATPSDIRIADHVVAQIHRVRFLREGAARGANFADDTHERMRVPGAGMTATALT